MSFHETICCKHLKIKIAKDVAIRMINFNSRFKKHTLSQIFRNFYILGNKEQHTFAKIFCLVKWPNIPTLIRIDFNKTLIFEIQKSFLRHIYFTNKYLIALALPNLHLRCLICLKFGIHIKRKNHVKSHYVLPSGKIECCFSNSIGFSF